MKFCKHPGCKNKFRTQNLCEKHYAWHRRKGTIDQYRVPPASEDFWRYVDKSGKCWTYTKGFNEFGYGRLSIKNKSIRAHRHSWELANGKIPKGLHVLHKCDNPPCVRPSHLYLGTDIENTRDKMRRGRYRCPRGEECVRSKLTEKQVKKIRQIHATGKMGYRKIATLFDVGRVSIRAIILRTHWKHI